MYSAQTHLRCNFVTFEIPKSFSFLVQKSIWDLKIDQITFQMGVCTVHTAFIQVNLVDQNLDSLCIFVAASFFEILLHLLVEHKPKLLVAVWPSNQFLRPAHRRLLQNTIQNYFPI